MNEEIRTEAVQFQEKEYINGILVAVYLLNYLTALSDSIALFLFSKIIEKTKTDTILHYEVGRGGMVLL
jgi:hypothetical protein